MHTNYKAPQQGLAASIFFLVLIVLLSAPLGAQERVDATAAYDPGNPFARIIRGELPADVVYENEYALAFHDISPQAKVHVLVIPKGQYTNIIQFNAAASDAEKLALLEAISETAKTMKVDESGFRLLANTGEHGGQSVPHLHFHIKGGEPVYPASNKEGTWIDLTHDLSDQAVFWPTAEPFKMTTDFEGMTDKGYYYSAYSFTTAEHGGTHIDAPVHFAEGTHHVDEIPLAQLIGDAVVIDVSAAVQEDRDHRVSVADLEAWEQIHGAIPLHAIVLLRTGFGDHWPDAGKYLGTEKRGAEGAAELSFPGLGPDAATWLIANRHIKAVGIDTASIDFGKSTHFETHVALMTHNVPAFENVANLEQLPARGVYVTALPVKIRGGSGGPLRIVARVR